MEVNKMNEQMHDLVSNQQQDHLTDEDMSTSSVQNNQQTNKTTKKRHGNRKLQRYRRKLRKEGLNSDVIANMISEWVDMGPRESNQPIKENSQTTASNVHETATITMTQRVLDRNPTTNNDSSSQMSLVQVSLVNEQKIDRQKINNKKITKRLNDSLDITETNSSPTIRKKTIATENPIKLEDISDEIFCQMLSTAFGDINKLDGYFLNEQEKIKFVRHYTDLISRLSYNKLLQEQWDHYYHIGTTHNIWIGRISKRIAEKNSICYTYGRSKKVIQQRHVQIEKQLREIHSTIQFFNREILFKLEQHMNCSLEIQRLISNINAFVYEHQQKLRDELEYKREMLILDSTDHHLVHTFFSFKPNKSQITSTRRIWEATAKQVLLNQRINILENRLTSVSLSATTTTTTTTDFFHCVLDNIDKNLAKSLEIKDQDTSNNYSSIEFENLNQLKKHIIHQGIETARVMIEPIPQTVHDKQEKFFFKKNVDEHISSIEDDMINAIETRRLHMIERGNYITEQKLSTSFKPISYLEDNTK